MRCLHLNHQNATTLIAEAIVDRDHMKMLASCFLLVGVASPALADLTAKYAKPGTSFAMTVEIASNGNMRGDAGQPGMSFITRDGHGYFLKSTPAGTDVMRVEDMGEVMSEQMAKLDPQFRAEMQQHAPVIKLVDKGTMTINGRTGTAYFMQAENGSLTPAPWAVISKDPALAPLGSAMIHQFEMSMATMSATTGTAPFANMLAVLKTGAPISFAGADLQSVDASPIPASRFELPRKPESLDRVRQLMSPTPPNQ
jgi:hypothetical protein